MVLAVLVALFLALCGATTLLAARAAAPAGDHRTADPAGPPADPQAGLSAPARLAVRVAETVERTALAVDVLVDRRASDEVLRERETDPQARRADLVVVGVGLLGLAVVMAIGVVLLVV